MDKLNEKQHKFALEYIKTGNAKQSYISAGYTGKGAEVSSCQLLKNPKVESFIDKHRAKAEKKNLVDLEYLTNGYKGLIEKHEDLTPNVAKGCYDSLAKMYGLNHPERIDITTNGDAINIHIEKTYIDKD